MFIGRLTGGPWWQICFEISLRFLGSCIHLAAYRTYFVLHLVSRRTLENLSSVHNTSRLYSLVTKKLPSSALIPPHARSGAPPGITLRPGPHVAPAKTSCGWGRKGACNIYVRHWPIIAQTRRHFIKISTVLIRCHDFDFQCYFGRFALQNNPERISKAEFSRRDRHTKQVDPGHGVSVLALPWAGCLEGGGGSKEILN